VNPFVKQVKNIAPYLSITPALSPDTLK
jgi:hypothetical protein